MADNSPTFQRWGPTVNRVQVPKGRLKLCMHAVNRPFGTYFASDGVPNVETLGYYRKSLRDRDLFAFRDFLRVLVAKECGNCILCPKEKREESEAEVTRKFLASAAWVP